MALELNRRRAVLAKIGEILRWQKTKEKEKGAQCVELRGFLCEVLARQFWRLDRLKSADEFLETHFPEQRRTACYLMVIHEHLPRISKLKLRLTGWTKVREVVKVPAGKDRNSIVHPGCTRLA